MLYYINLTYYMNKNHIHQLFTLCGHNLTDEKIRKIVTKIVEEKLNPDKKTISIEHIGPFNYLNEHDRLIAIRNIIYEDIIFHCWKLKHYEYPNIDILRTLRYRRINMFCSSSITKNDVALNRNFITMHYLISSDLINAIPYLPVEQSEDMKMIKEIIDTSTNDVLNIFILPKNIDISHVLTVMGYAKNRENFRYYINDDSNGLYQIENDRDVIVFKKVSE